MRLQKGKAEGERKERRYDSAEKREMKQGISFRCVRNPILSYIMGTPEQVRERGARRGTGGEGGVTEGQKKKKDKKRNAQCGLSANEKCNRNEMRESRLPTQRYSRARTLRIRKEGDEEV